LLVKAGVLKTVEETEADKEELPALPVATIQNFDWRSRAEAVFHELDLNKDMLIEFTEMESIFGPDAETVLAKLTHDEFGNVDLYNWILHAEFLKRIEGLEAVDSWLSYSEKRVWEYRHTHETKQYARAQAKAKAKASRPEEFAGAMEVLDKKLGVRIEKDRLVQRGVIRDKHEHAVKNMGLAMAKESLENKLTTRQDKERLQTRGRIKTKDEHAEALQERSKQTFALADALSHPARPTHGELVAKGIIRLKVDPAAEAEVSMSSLLHRGAQNAFAPTTAAYRSRVQRMLSSPPKTIECKYTDPATTPGAMRIMSSPSMSPPGRHAAVAHRDDLAASRNIQVAITANPRSPPSTGRYGLTKPSSHPEWLRNVVQGNNK